MPPLLQDFSSTWGQSGNRTDAGFKFISGLSAGSLLETPSPPPHQSEQSGRPNSCSRRPRRDTGTGSGHVRANPTSQCGWMVLALAFRCSIISHQLVSEGNAQNFSVALKSELTGQDPGRAPALAGPQREAGGARRHSSDDVREASATSGRKKSTSALSQVGDLKKVRFLKIVQHFQR